jgi:hypothetical protein
MAVCRNKNAGSKLCIKKGSESGSSQNTSGKLTDLSETIYPKNFLNITEESRSYAAEHCDM